MWSHPLVLAVLTVASVLFAMHFGQRHLRDQRRQESFVDGYDVRLLILDELALLPKATPHAEVDRVRALLFDEVDKIRAMPAGKQSEYIKGVVASADPTSGSAPRPTSPAPAQAPTLDDLRQRLQQVQAQVKALAAAVEDLAGAVASSSSSVAAETAASFTVPPPAIKPALAVEGFENIPVFALSR